MADRVAVFNEGRIVQAGAPEDIYRRPKTRFVADFVGSSNVLPPDFSARHFGQPKWTSLRPESIRLVDDGALSATVVSRSFMGATNRLLVEKDGARLHLMLPANQVPPESGSEVRLGWNAGDVHVMEGEA